MNRKGLIIGLVVLAVLLCSGGFLFVFEWRRKDAEHTTGWLEAGQPPLGIANQGTAPADQSWAANRCRPMIASCTGLTAATRLRRTYPETLADSADSIVRARVDVGE